MPGTTKVFVVLGCLLALSGGVTAIAGPLATASNAYIDGNGPDSGAWRGSASYSNGPLFGTIDYAVFTAAGFAAEFPSAVPGDYNPTSGELVYAYQIRNGGGSAAVSFESVSADPADNIGSFEITSGDIEPTAESLSGFGTAEWIFLFPEIGPNENSFGLVFSSLNRPEFSGTSVTIDGGFTAIATVPTPGDIRIPEPSALMLLCIGGVMLRWLGRRFGGGA
jgi:hypothetical protein